MRAAASLADNRNKSAHVILLERRIPNSPPVLESENLCDHNGAVLVTATLQQKLNTGMAPQHLGKQKPGPIITDQWWASFERSAG
jgi:hypothetical protein